MSDDIVPDLAELFSRNPSEITTEEIMASLPLWRQARARFNLGVKEPAPAAKAKAKPAKAPTKPIDLSALGLLKK